jgi:hypothetical protein
MQDIVTHRFIYRPGTGGSMVDQVEQRSMKMHLDRLMVQGRVALANEQYEAVRLNE